jgi:hypothetical protein
MQFVGSTRKGLQAFAEELFGMVVVQIKVLNGEVRRPPDYA